MEHLHRLLVISLQSCPRKEHVRHLSKSQSCMRIQELNVGWDYVDVPFCKVGVSEHKQINNVGKTKRDTRKQN